MKEIYNILRPEAGAISYWKHHNRSKESLNFIIRILNDAVNSVQGAKPVKGDSGIDANRASRIVFVSGEPGSGKSTMYLSLRAMLSSKERDKYQVGYDSGKNQNINLNGILENVRWLDALDLEVAGDEGENLLAAVLVRVIEVLSNDNTVSRNTYSKSCDDAIRDLEDLATDIGIAWEGNLSARAGSLDPDTYSEEVMRTQRARLRINERLKKALDDIAESNCYGCNPNTLFVLPVDDFYLKPNASLHLLRLLRMISIPRLFFLVMGDIKTIEALFVEKSLADWTAVAGTELFAERPDRLDDALTRARELRARYLRKLLPPGQRATVEPMDWYEARDFVPSRVDGVALTIEDILDEVKLDKPRVKSEEDSVISLSTLLISPTWIADPFKKNDEKQKRKNKAKGRTGNDAEPNEEINLRDARSAYTALQILDATPRELMDLGAALRDVVRRKGTQLKEAIEFNKAKDSEGGETDTTPLLLLQIRDIVDLVKEEQSFLNADQQAVLEGILPTRQYSPENINFDLDRLCLNSSHGTWKELISGELWVREQSSWDITANSDFIDKSKNRNLDIVAHNSLLNKSKSINSDLNENEIVEQNANNPYAKLPPRPAAWFVLLHDLACMWSSESLKGNLIKRICEEINDWNLHRKESAPVYIEKNLDSHFYKKSKIKPDPSIYFRGWAIWRDEENYKHFPIPEFETFRDLDRFLYVWSRYIKRIAKSEEINLSRVKSVWLLAGWTILAGAYENFAADDNGWYDHFSNFTADSDVELLEKFKMKLEDLEEEFQYPHKKIHNKIQKWLNNDDWKNNFVNGITKKSGNSLTVNSQKTKGKRKKSE